MKFNLLFIFTIAFLNCAVAQTASDYAIQLAAQTQQSPAQITLSWKAVTGGTGYAVYKKAKAGTAWGTALYTGTATTYTDNAVITDSAYEYKVVLQGGTQGTGYIYAGIINPAIHNRGAVLLLVDSTFTDSCSAELKQLMRDISGDGWEVLRKDFSRTTIDVTVKSYITGLYQSNANLKAVFIIGHIAVPYSGEINPDGHPDHLGAWPADVFYADMDGSWTDVSVNNSTASRTQNQNVPADGKWDQSLIPTPTELQISRIDFANMPTFTATEIQLMKNYLAKDHQYKLNQLTVIHRGLVDDNFGAFSGEAFAANAFRNFPPLVGKDSITAPDFITALNTSSYQWAYGCGGGSYTTASGIGSTANFSTNNVNAIFTQMFGSYFGDWDAQNNFLRAPLCSNTPALTSCWAGRPNWFFHHMALGENIGYSAFISQNNSNAAPLYTPSNYGSGFIHVALLGDLTLRTDYIKPATGVTLTPTASVGAVVNWTASAEPGVIGYYVYRADKDMGFYYKCSPLITGTNFTDSAGINGMKYYMVRAVKLQQTPSGSYYNLSLGNIDSGNITYAVGIKPVAASNVEMTLFPNPGKNQLNLQLNSSIPATAQILLTDMEGRKAMVETINLTGGTNTISLDVTKLPAGVYLFSLKTDKAVYSKKWTKLD